MLSGVQSAGVYSTNSTAASHLQSLQRLRYAATTNDRRTRRKSPLLMSTQMRFNMVRLISSLCCLFWCRTRFRSWLTTDIIRTGSPGQLNKCRWIASSHPSA
jgi:hypothetical protein